MNYPQICTPIILLAFSLSTVQVISQNEISAKELVEKADENMEGESSISVMSMSIIRPTWERTLEFKNWVKGKEYALTLITAPAKEKGQTFLKRNNEMWNYIPSIGRLIKLPPSMMSQGWMGSDYTNDDVMNETSLSTDFEHKYTGNETLENNECKIIEMIPHDDSNIVWGKIITWISLKDHLFLKTEYYDEDDFLIRTELFENIQEMDGRRIPTRYVIIPADNPNQKTLINIKSMDFDPLLDDDFFSQQNMKRIK
jgi:outer membrane lipoprotein-sorting protein